MIINANIIGATGYTGIELIRLLLSHPNAKFRAFTKSGAHSNLSDIYAHFSGTFDEALLPFDVDESAKGDVAFLCLPHGESAAVAHDLLERNIRVIDMSADSRYDSAAVYGNSYGAHPYPELLDLSVYGLSELYADKIRDAKLVGNPGCYTTCSILALYPLLKHGLISPDSIIIDAKSGVTGAGRKLDRSVHFCEAHENFKAYAVAAHRHTSEIEQELSHAAGSEVMVSFTPHLLPVKRGILCTSYAQLLPRVTEDDIMAAYMDMYRNTPFVRLACAPPELKDVNGSNHCAISFVIDKRLNRVIVISALDNLIKGASGQAVQNMNIMFGLDEKLGLPVCGYYL